MLLRIGIVIGTVVVALVVFAIYMGAFRRVQIVERDEGPFLFIYRGVKGVDQGTIGAVTTELHGVLTTAGVEGMRPLDIFHPPADGLLNEIGFEIPISEAPKLLTVQGFSRKTIPRQRYMATAFPFRNRLSFMVGYVKVDPALKAYRQQKLYGAAWAIARNDGDTITYLQPAIPNPR